MIYKNHTIKLTPDSTFSNKENEGFLIEISKENKGIIKSFRSPFASESEATEEAERAIDRGCLPGIFQ